MKKTKINVYANLNNIEENNEFFAIKDENLIKYIDLENNKMIVDIKNNIIIRENIDYLFNIDFVNEKMEIMVKKIKKTFIKPIKTLSIYLSKREYSVKYLLLDDNIINEYFVKF